MSLLPDSRLDINERLAKIAKARAFQLVPETCPVIESAFTEALDTVKSQTEALREALIDALFLVHEKEERIKELESTIRDLNEIITDLVPVN